MAICRGCGAQFDWGFCNGRWVPLEPVESHDDMDRTYVDENAELRADHRDRHPHGASVNVERLDAKVKAADAPAEQQRMSIGRKLRGAIAGRGGRDA